MSVETIFIVSRVTELVCVDSGLNERLRLLGDILARGREDNKRSYAHAGGQQARTGTTEVPHKCDRSILPKSLPEPCSQRTWCTPSDCAGRGGAYV